VKTAHHICDFAGVLALESCYLELLRRRPAEEEARIAQILGRFAHQAGAGACSAPSPEQQLLGRLHTTAMCGSRSLTKGTAKRCRLTRDVFNAFVGPGSVPSPDTSVLAPRLDLALRDIARTAFVYAKARARPSCPIPPADVVLALAWRGAGEVSVSISRDLLFLPTLEERQSREPAVPRDEHLTRLALQAAGMSGSMAHGWHRQIMKLLCRSAKDAGVGESADALGRHAAECFTRTFDLYRSRSPGPLLMPSIPNGTPAVVAPPVLPATAASKVTPVSQGPLSVRGHVRDATGRRRCEARNFAPG
jgi:hypothetical protein